jgi:hypothetical protein
MNIIIEDAETLNYFTNEGGWSKDANEGKQFSGTTQAYNAARHEPIGKFNITGYVAQTHQLINLRSGRGTGLVVAPVA